MKKIFVTVFTVVSLTGMVNAQKPGSSEQAFASSPVKAAICTWEKTSHNFGTIPQGKPVSIVYSFTNSGNAPLIISNVHPSCGCTTEDFSKESVAPGKKGFVKLTYNAASLGSFTKSTTVQMNAEPGTFTLLFNGDVTAGTSAEK